LSKHAHNKSNVVDGCHFEKLPYLRNGLTGILKKKFSRHNRAVFHQISMKLECGPMPNLMVALPNIGGALCSTLQSLADAHY